MKIIKAKGKTAIAKAARHLMQGGVVIYPTETSYGIGALVSSMDGLEEVLRLKGSRKREAFLVLVSGIRMARRYAELGPIGGAIAKTYWPGPITIIAPLKKRVCPHVINKKNEIAVRHSSNEFATKLAIIIL